MNDESDSLAGSLRELASEARQRQGPDAHPSPETLTAYHAGELTSAAGEEVQEHLAVCRHCARLLLDLPAFLDAPAADVADTGLAAEVSWQRIRNRLPGPAGRAGRQPDSAPATGHRSTPRRRLVWLAAAALVALVAAPLWIIAMRPSAEKRVSAQTALPVVSLYPLDEQRGPSPAPPPTPTRVNPEACDTILLLYLGKEQPNLHFLVELRTTGASGAGTRSQTLPVASIVSSRTLLLTLARHQLAPGRYRLLVLDAEHPAAEPLGDYPLQVVAP